MTDRKGATRSSGSRSGGRAVNWQDTATSVISPTAAGRKGVRATVVTTPSPPEEPEGDVASYADLFEPCTETIVIQGPPKGKGAIEDDGDFFEDLLNAAPESIRTTKFHKSPTKTKGSSRGVPSAENSTGREGGRGANNPNSAPQLPQSRSQIRQRKVHAGGDHARRGGSLHTPPPSSLRNIGDSSDGSDPSESPGSSDADVLLQQPKGFLASIPHSWSLLKALGPMLSTGYDTLTSPQIKLVDALAATNALVWFIQALYAVLVTRHPIRSTIGGLTASSGLFILTICLRLQLTTPGSFNYVSTERAFVDFLLCCFMLLLAVFTYLD